jgi:hypothetical protein
MSDRSRVRPVIAALCLSVLLTSPAAAQDSAPPGWRWHTDAPARLIDEQVPPEGAWRFVSMAPGWHVTTAPGALMWEPRLTTAGRFSAKSEMILFPDPSDAGFGLLVGGRDLDTPDATWTAFLIRRDGSAAVVERRGGLERTVVEWRRHDAIKPHPGPGTVSNVLGLSADAARITFTVNDVEVASVPRGRVTEGGAIGFRIGAALNMHITTLDVTYHLAPARPPGG